ncbi:MAG: hypothetical protein ACLSIP_19960 [Hungatella sp.]
MLIGVPVIITQHLGFSINTANRLYGYAQGVIASGSIAGGLLAGILSKKLKPKAIPALITGAAVSMLLIREDRRPRISSVFLRRR